MTKEPKTLITGTSGAMFLPWSKPLFEGEFETTEIGNLNSHFDVTFKESRQSISQSDPESIARGTDLCNPEGIVKDFDEPANIVINLAAQALVRDLALQKNQWLETKYS